MAFDMLIGSDALRARLGEDVRGGMLSHAYIIEGAAGSGKRTLTLALAAATACTSRDALPCEVCPACRKILEGKSPDVMRIAPEKDKASIGVDGIRFLRTDVLIPPNELDHKIYIIEQADTMTVQAQNALLRTLEEPPEYVIFLLLCESASRFLETILSRAQRMRLAPIARDAMRAYLTRTSRPYAALPAEEREQLLLLSGGSIGRALTLLDAKERALPMARRDLAGKYVEAMLGRRDMAAMPALMNTFGTKRDEIDAVLGDVTVALRDLLLLKRADAPELCFYVDREAALDLCARASMQALLHQLERVDTAREQLGRNANVRLVLTSLLYL